MNDFAILWLGFNTGAHIVHKGSQFRSQFIKCTYHMAIYKDKNLNGSINLIRLHPGLISSLNRNEEKVEKITMIYEGH